MKCRDALPLLSGYLDQELSTVEIRKVAAHLESCRSCEGALNEFRMTRTLLQGLDPESPRRGFWMESYGRLAAASPRRPSWWQRLTQQQRSAMVLTPALVGAALAVLVQFQPTPQPVTTNEPPILKVDELVQAHLEARDAQPLADQGVVRMLLVNAQPAPTDPLAN